MNVIYILLSEDGNEKKEAVAMFSWDPWSLKTFHITIIIAYVMACIFVFCFGLFECTVWMCDGFTVSFMKFLGCYCISDSEF